MTAAQSVVCEINRFKNLLLRRVSTDAQLKTLIYVKTQAAPWATFLACGLKWMYLTLQQWQQLSHDYL